jgi:uncharacterized protein YjbI with pentapeptide repeats
MTVDSPKLPQVLLNADPEDLEDAITIEGVHITGLNWSNGEAKRPSFDAVRFTNPDMSLAKLRDGGWADVEILGGLLAGTNLTGSTIRRIVVNHVRASGLVVAETEGRHITVKDSKLDLSNFRFAKWSHVRFVDCTFAGADFAGSTMSDVSFENCELDGCDFSGARFSRVDLNSSRITKVKGLGGLRGALMTYEQLIGLLPEVALEMGIKLLNK